MGKATFSASTMTPQEIPGSWKLFTDGGCRVNPGGLGGWGAVLIPPNSDTPRARLSGVDPTTTNNRMEMMALINGLREVPAGESVTIFTDSQYLIWAVQDWPVASRKSKEKAKNKDLLEQISNCLDRLGTSRCVWVKGHSGDRWNEECDKLANREMDLWESRFADGYP